MTQPSVPPIAIREGGERLYAYPFARQCNPALDRFHYFFPELQPHPNDNIANDRRCGCANLAKECFTSPQDRLRWWWALGLGRLLWVIWHCLWAFRREHGLRHAWWRFRNRRDVVVFLATDFPGLQLHLPHQLQVEDPEGLCSDCYLTPTPKWVELQLLQPVSEPHHEEERREYRAWRCRWASAADIDFLLVLDT